MLLKGYPSTPNASSSAMSGKAQKFAGQVIPAFLLCEPGVKAFRTASGALPAAATLPKAGLGNPTAKTSPDPDPA